LKRQSAGRSIAATRPLDWFHCTLLRNVVGGQEERTFACMTFTKTEQDKYRKNLYRRVPAEGLGSPLPRRVDQQGHGLARGRNREAPKEDVERDIAIAIKEAEVAVDFHTVENRNKRKAMEERRNSRSVASVRISSWASNHSRASTRASRAILSWRSSRRMELERSRT
jgi:hypothetical protein